MTPEQEARLRERRWGDRSVIAFDVGAAMKEIDDLRKENETLRKELHARKVGKTAWLDAIDEWFVVSGQTTPQWDEPPKEQIARIVGYEIGIALDPSVSEDARQLQIDAAAKERERAAVMCAYVGTSRWHGLPGEKACLDCAEAIRNTALVGENKP